MTRLPRLILAATLTAAAAPLPVLAGDAAAARAALLEQYAAEARAADPAFTAFSAAAGESLFRTRWATGDARTPACTACHTDDPRSPGRNARTGRPIGPVAVSANPSRFTDPAEVEKQFGRDCEAVLGRACTAREKGDYITFMQEQ